MIFWARTLCWTMLLMSLLGVGGAAYMDDWSSVIEQGVVGCVYVILLTVLYRLR